MSGSGEISRKLGEQSEMFFSGGQHEIEWTAVRSPSEAYESQTKSGRSQSHACELRPQRPHPQTRPQSRKGSIAGKCQLVIESISTRTRAGRRIADFATTWKISWLSGRGDLGEIVRVRWCNRSTLLEGLVVRGKASKR